MCCSPMFTRTIFGSNSSQNPRWTLKCVVPLCLHVPFLVLIVVRTHDGPKKCVVPLCLYTIFGSDTVVLVIRTHDGPKKCEAFRYVYTSFLVLIQ